MSAFVYIDALIYWNGVLLPQSNNIKLGMKQIVKESRPICDTIQDTYVTKQPGWLDWSVELEAYYDTPADVIREYIAQDQSGQLLIYPSRAVSYHWVGNAFTNNVHHGQDPLGFSKLSVAFSSDGVLGWSGPARYIISESGKYIITESGKYMIMEQW